MGTHVWPAEHPLDCVWPLEYPMYLMDCALSLLCWPAHKAVIGFHDFVLYLNRAKAMCGHYHHAANRSYASLCTLPSFVEKRKM
jgi:hypothetical protein